MLKLLSILIICFGTILCMGFSRSRFKTNEEYVASIIYSEALGESDYGKNLVATVIWVRAKGNTNEIRKVCSIPKQFANPQKNNDPEWKECHLIAQRMYQGKFEPVSIINQKGEAIHPDHFFVHGWPTPFWARGKWWKKIGKLNFLKLDKFREK